jgi:pSer/pThr/pTyr-binding forkhead associated (FHA) protein
MAVAVFRVCSGSRAGQRLKVPAWPLVIGRAETCDLRLNSDQISRLHCELRHESDGIVVRDLRSRNGTFVNGSRIEAATILVAGDRLRVGGIEFELVVTPEVATTVAPLPAAEPASRDVDPTRMTLDELVQFDDDPLTLESDDPNPITTDSEVSSPATSIGSFGTTIIDHKSQDTSPLPGPASKKPASGADFTSHAARDALKKIFRGRS